MRSRLALRSIAAWDDAAPAGPAPILSALSGGYRGVLHARDVAIALLDEANYEELLLRNYVMGIGYQ